MAREKEQMADQLKQLEKQMTDTARSLAGTQNPVSSKLRDALSEAEQNELELRMRKAAEWIRQGQGMQTWVRESTVTMGLNRLRDQLQQAQAGMQQQGEPGKGPGDKADIEKALAQLEGMRNRISIDAGTGSEGRRISRNNGKPQPGQGKQPGQGQQGQAQQGNAARSRSTGPGTRRPIAIERNRTWPGPGFTRTTERRALRRSRKPRRFRRNGPAQRNGAGLSRILARHEPTPRFIRTHPEYSGEVLQLLHAMSPAYANDAKLSQPSAAR